MSADDQREQRAVDLDRLERQHERARGGWMDASARYELDGEMFAALPDLIAAARERDRLRAKVATVLAAHQPYRTPYREADICDTCSRGDGPDVLWPCPTAATLGDQP